MNRPGADEKMIATTQAAEKLVGEELRLNNQKVYNHEFKL